MRIITALALLSSLIASLVSFTSFAHAQTISGDFGSDITVLVAPLSPAPGDTVTLTVESPVIDTGNSTITWYNNGKVIAQGIGQTSATIVAGALGHTSTVAVSVKAPDGSTAAAQVPITPTEIDLLVDSDSYVPPFYLGRALPSAGTNIRVQAIAHLKRANGTAVPSTDITYIWKQDNRVVGTVSGRGKSSATLPAASLYGTTDIEVDAKSSDGTLSGSATISIPAVTPVIALYEDNPLLGFMYNNAFGTHVAVVDSAMTFAAVPYYAQARSPNDARLLYTWTVNGSNVAASKDDPSELTLNGSGSGIHAQVDLGLTHSTNIFMSVNGTWDITLGSRTSGSGSTVSGSNPIKSPFIGQ